MKHCQEQINNYDKAIFVTIKMETTWKRNNENSQNRNAHCFVIDYYFIKILSELVLLVGYAHREMYYSCR